MNTFAIGLILIVLLAVSSLLKSGMELQNISRHLEEISGSLESISESLYDMAQNSSKKDDGE